jgi:hypothetical protein
MCELLDEQGSEGEIKGIVCSEHNRLARNFGDGVGYLGIYRMER